MNVEAVIHTDVEFRGEKQLEKCVDIVRRIKQSEEGWDRMGMELI